MERSYHPSISLLFGLLLLLQATCLSANDDFRVIVSIKPIHSILSALMEGTSGPQLLVKKGKTPFDYELDDQQKKDLQQADFIIWVGPELEKFLIEPLKKVKSGAEVITLLNNPNIKILDSRWDNSKRDPFIWMDSRNILILIDELTRKLMYADGARGHVYKRNRDKLYARMAALDRKLEYGYRGLKTGIGISYFDSLQYFEQAYALKIRGHVTEHPDTPIDTAKMLENRKKIADGYYSCLLTESGIDMPDLPLLLGENKIQQAKLDSFGTKLTPGPQLYFQLIENNTQEIKKCLHKGQKLAATVAEDDYSEPTEIGGKFMLVDHNGKLVTEKDLMGKFQIILFGYTYCPDICPSSLQVLSIALNKLGTKADKIQPYFITVDPDRDTVEKMNRYVGYFNKRIIGLTGSKAMIEKVAKQFKVKYEKVIEEGMDDDMYIMDHTASAYLMAPNGSFITKFAYGITPKQMVKKINEYIK